MTVEGKSAAGTSDYSGKRYYFCSKDCKTEFDENPVAESLVAHRRVAQILRFMTTGRKRSC